LDAFAHSAHPAPLASNLFLCRGIVEFLVALHTIGPLLAEGLLVVGSTVVDFQVAVHALHPGVHTLGKCTWLDRVQHTLVTVCARHFELAIFAIVAGKTGLVAKPRCIGGSDGTAR